MKAGLPARYLRALLLRGVVVWLGARFAVVALFAAIRGMADRETAALFTETNPLVLSAWTLGLCATLLHFDLHRRHEVSLLNNLGITTSYAVTMGTGPAMFAELAMLFL
jgi:hypothetical protein